ncbi:phage virion morphogenesis protein [Pseudomonas sp. PDM14]|uniref:phage virion morphogenesis protein n=1 Tax=Pseudomonas sp. PDM14 TaxID=2769288 RepID=UPI00177FDDF1|nr:phage virion morphogenesis protein [Pseudomonas sp. PDM14]MBD9483908.1 phage virion morphogenesis protein [Pseudomonas sp. PDM14]
MADTFDDLSNWLTPLMLRLAPAERAKLAREVAQGLRRSQQQRVIAQRNPDGTPYEPRKERQLRGKQGRIKRKAKMFTKLRTARYLKATGNAGAATVAFAGRISRIARVHQFGLRDRAERGAPDVQYAQRELLGFTDAERDYILDRTLAHLTL